MFGTLVIQLPSKFSGGSLVVQHGSEARTLDFSSESEDAFFATAFYADCEHELEPVTDGWRLCLVYNLVIPPQSSLSSFSLPCAGDLTFHSRQLRRLVSQWENACPEPFKGYVLEHKYTETNLRFINLKGRDKKVVDLLRNACDIDRQPLFVVCLLLLQKHETGSCEPSYYGYHGSGPHTMDDVYDSETSAHHWVGPDDKVISNFDAPFDAKKCLMLDDGEEIEDLFDDYPDEEDYEGYTGNAGPTMDYWYYRSAVVFWPVSKNLEMRGSKRRRF
jgi:hypothetical protein